MIFKIIRNSLLYFLFFILINQSAFAQKKSKIICPDDLLYRSFVFAKNNQYYKAKDVLYNIIADYPNCAEAYSRLADLSYRTNDTFYTLHYTKRLMELNPEKGMQTILALNETMKEYGDEALGIRLLEFVKTDSKLEEKKINVLENVMQLNSNRQKLLNSNVAEKPLKMSGNINTNTTQCYPSLTLNGKKLYYTKVVNELNEDFYVSEIMDSCEGWNKAVPLGSPPNTGGPDGASQISADGNYLFFTKCDQRSQNGYDGGGCDVFFCYRTNDGWSSPEKFKSTINSMHYEGQPCLNSLNTELYFVSDRKGGYGGKDIYKAKFQNGLWQEPINLGSQINSKYDDESPFIHPDNNTLYFVSNNISGLGGQDFYISKKLHDTAWEKAKNLGAPFNSERNENSLCVAANGVDAIIASNRDNAVRAFSLYNVVLPKFAQATPTHCVQGILYDKLSGDILPNMEIEVMDSAFNVMQKCKTNLGDASFTFPLKAGAKYYYSISDVVDYKNFKQEINLSVNNKMPALVKANAYLKIADGVDTLYSASFFGSENQDTTLYHLTHDFENWHTQAEDSIILQCTITYNNHVDVKWLQTVSTTDSLRDLFINQQIELQQKEEKEVLEYFDFFLRYIAQKQLPIKSLQILRKADSWTSKERYKLDITAIEYY